MEAIATRFEATDLSSQSRRERPRDEDAHGGPPNPLVAAVVGHAASPGVQWGKWKKQGMGRAERRPTSDAQMPCQADKDHLHHPLHLMNISSFLIIVAEPLPLQRPKRLEDFQLLPALHLENSRLWCACCLFPKIIKHKSQNSGQRTK